MGNPASKEQVREEDDSDAMVTSPRSNVRWLAVFR
jgi:hypothetical protein